MSDGYDLAECLGALNPCTMEYTDWVQIGMALNHEGYSFDVWDAWSSQDTKRYKGNGSMLRKWQGFGASANPVTGGTVVQMARDNGWSPDVDRGEALGWEDTELSADPGMSGRIVDPSWIEASDVVEPGDTWDGWRDLVRYLETLFDANEVVGYVSESWDKDGRWLPSNKGPHNETAGELIASLTKHKSDLGASVGWNNTEAGAWIRFNPLDGNGVRNDNVAEFRYALVESDNMSVERQKAIIEQLELPVAALVHSGNKSIHAVVKVDAKDYDEYRKRVDFLYDTCKKNGLNLDTQNKNPSRLSRMPGVMRNGRKQWLISTNTGRASWAEWREWLDEQNDDLPDPESLADVWDELPELSPPLIDGVLRQGHKMMLGGPSKAGKSFALIELCVALAEGEPWLGFNCAKGRVLYVNLELDRASCLHRFKDVYVALGLTPANVGNIDIWNLRGKSKPMDKLAPSLIRRALKTRPIAVVIDPIYKVITGDENSADQMAAFCNQFDRVANELGCAVVYCHHHSKGTQGGKRSMDRVSGSGVFARDPDALLDMIELEQTDALRQQQEDEAVCAAIDGVMSKVGPDGWEDVIGQDDRLMAKRYMEGARAMLDRDGEHQMLDAVYAARQAAKGKTAWRIEGTLREFPRFDPLNLWFDYPVHKADKTGVLADVAADGSEEASRQKGTENAAKRRKIEQAEKLKLMQEAMDQCRRDGVQTTRANVLERIGEFKGSPVSADSIKNWTVNKATWSTIRVDPEHKAEGLLIDTVEADLLEDW